MEDYFYLHDDQFNVTGVVNLQGQVVERYDYDDFGAPTIMNAGGTVLAASAIANPYLWNGRRLDPESKLYYYRTRYMEPSTGQFTTRDIIGIWGDPSNLGSGRAYVMGNPWRYFDPFGLRTEGYDEDWRNVHCVYDPAACMSGLNATMYKRLGRIHPIEPFPPDFLPPSVGGPMPGLTYCADTPTHITLQFPGSEDDRWIKSIEEWFSLLSFRGLVDLGAQLGPFGMPLDLLGALLDLLDGNYEGATLCIVGVIIPGAQYLDDFRRGRSKLKTIVESQQAMKKADKLAKHQRNAYEEIKDSLAQGRLGRHDHPLSRDLSGTRARDLRTGGGKGRGRDRVIYRPGEDEVEIIDIVDYHRNR